MNFKRKKLNKKKKMDSNSYMIAVLHDNGDEEGRDFIKIFEEIGKKECEGFDLVHFSFNTDKDGKKKEKICKVCLKKSNAEFFKTEKGKKFLEKEKLNLMNYKYSKLKYFNKKQCLKADNFSILKNIINKFEGKFLRKGSFEFSDEKVKLKNNEAGKFPYNFIKLLKAILDNSQYESEEDGTKYLKVEYC